MYIEIAFDRVPRKVLELAMRKESIREVVGRSWMSLYEGAKTRVRVDSELTEEFEAKVGMHQGSVLSPLSLAVVVDISLNLPESARSDLLDDDGLVLMSETMERVKENVLG